MLTKFKTKKVSIMATAGECLKKKREEDNLSIRDISEKLKIKASHLENLEKNDYNQLPSDVYVKGFIRNYAQFIDLDEQEIVNLYLKERNIESRIKDKKNVKLNLNKKKSFSIFDYLVITPKIITIILSVLILSVVGYYLWHQISSFSSTPYLFISSPLQDGRSEESEIMIIGQTEPRSILRINGENVFIDADGNFSEIVLLESGNNIFVVESLNRFDKKARETRNIIYEKKLDPAPVYFFNEDEIQNNEDEEILFDGEIEFIGP